MIKKVTYWSNLLKKNLADKHVPKIGGLPSIERAYQILRGEIKRQRNRQPCVFQQDPVT
jgi:hypothetical protein